MRQLLGLAPSLAADAARNTDLTRAAKVLYQWGVPVIVPPSCTMGANGAFSALSTALITTFANCYFVLPTGYITSGSAAGVYYVQMSSTTAGTIFNNVLAAGSAPAVIASPTAFVCTAGTGTQVTGAQTAVTVPIAGGSMGANGLLHFKAHFLGVNNANTRNVTATLGGTQVAIESSVSNNWYGFERTIRNMASQAVQVTVGSAIGNAPNDVYVATGTPSFYTINTASSQNLVFTMSMGVVTDYLILLGATVDAVFAA